MGRLNGGKDYSSVMVNYSKNGSGFPLRVHSLSVLTLGFQVCQEHDGNSWCCETEIRRCPSPEARLAVVSASSGQCCVAAVKGGLLQHRSEVASAASLRVI